MSDPSSEPGWEPAHGSSMASHGRRASSFDRWSTELPCPGIQMGSGRYCTLGHDSLPWPVPPRKLPTNTWSKVCGSENRALPRRPLCLVMLAVASLLALEFASYLVQVQQRKPALAETLIAAAERRLEASGQSPAPPDAAASRCGHAESHEDHKHHSGAFEPIIFFILAYIASAVAQQIMAIMPESIRVPHSVNLFIIGWIMASFASNFAAGSEFGRTFKQFQQADPHIIFWVLLPAILYEDSSGVNWYVMQKVLPNCLLLAIPGVIVNALLTGCIIKGVFGSIDWTWDAAFLLGSILSATDPVAVMGALHELNAPDKLALLVSGESLVNDGSAVVIFMLFWESARGLRKLTPGYSVGFFIRMACGGPLLGLIVALLAYQWLKKTRKFNIEILVLLVVVYGTFFFAEHPQVKVSGVLAVVVFGFFMAGHGHFAINIDEMHRHHAIVKFMALLSNEAIFVLAGTVAYAFMRETTFQVRDYVECGLLFFIIHCTRALVLVVFMPLLSRSSSYGLNWKEAVICLVGGLRGAVGLAMALMVEHDKRLDSATRSRVAFHTSGIVLGTLLINGTTIKHLYKRLNLYPKPAHHRKMLSIALRKADMITRRRASIFEQHWFFHNCYFGDLWTLVPSLSSQMELLERAQTSHGFFRRNGVKSMVDRVSSLNVGGHRSGDEAGMRSKTVNKVMVDIALKLGMHGLHENPDGRITEKIRFRRKRANAKTTLNMFLPTTFSKASEEFEDKNADVIMLALHISKDEFEKAKAAEQTQREMWTSVIDAARLKNQYEEALSTGPYPSEDAAGESADTPEKSLQEDSVAVVGTETRQATISTKPPTCQVQTDDFALQDVSDDSQAPTPGPEPQSILRRPPSPEPLPPTDEPPSTRPKKKPSKHLRLSLDSEESAMSLGRGASSNTPTASAAPMTNGCPTITVFESESAPPIQQAHSLPSWGRRDSRLNSRSKMRRSLQSIDTLSRLSRMSRTSAARQTVFGDRSAAASEDFESHQPLRFESSNAFQVDALLRHASQVHDNFMEVTSKVIRVAKAKEALLTIKSCVSTKTAEQANQRGVSFKLDDDTEKDADEVVDWDEPMMDGKVTAKQLRCRLRWQLAKDRVLWALNKIEHAHRERHRLYEEIAAGDFGRHSTRDHIIRDAASMVEIFQTVLNFQRSMYHHMYEAHSISESSYRVLMDSLEVQEEAINGELRKDPYNPNDEDPNEDLKRLELGTHEEQMSLCFAVAWQLISRHLGRNYAVYSYFQNVFGGCCSCWVQGSFWLMREDLEILLAFVMTHDQLLEDLEVLRQFEFEVKRPLRKICERVKATSMFKLNQKDPALFAFVEHIICVKLMCGLQQHLIMDMAKEGLLSEEDAHHVISYLIAPVQEAVESYSPSRSQLALASSSSFAMGKVSSSLDPSFFRRNKAMLKKKGVVRGSGSHERFAKGQTTSYASELGGSFGRSQRHQATSQAWES